MRRAGLTALALLCCLLPAACSPPYRAITAVFLDQGQPTTIFHPCGGATVFEVAVLEEPGGPAPASGGSASATGADSVLTWDVADTEGGHPVAQVRLLQTPPGWILQTTKPGALLTAFAADRTYSVWPQTTNPSAGQSDHVQFTLGDLNSLSDGQVWASPKPFAQPRAMTRKEFAQHAEDSC
jgi:hypothetical protein